MTRASCVSSTRWRDIGVVLAVVSALAIGCGSNEGAPSQGTYTINFPSTAAAIATDTVQLFVFDVPASERPTFCQDRIAARKRGDALEPLVALPPVNICELRLGKRPLTIPYGEKAIVAVAQRKAKDFMIGCNIQYIGDGNAILPIPVTLVDVVDLPETTCDSVGAFCEQVCPPP